MEFDLRLGDCVDVMRTLPDQSIDAIITDPPYPEIDRDYGRMTEAEWHEMMRGVIAESRRILKPSGSAVFILQPNMEKLGRMRPWLFEFQAWACREWNMVQDAWWWNFSAIPQECSMPRRGMLKPSVKACVWLGEPDCYRDQDAVLWEVSEGALRKAEKAADRGRVARPSGHGMDAEAAYRSAIKRGGTSPMNLIPFANARGHESSAGNGHGASTPTAICEWWIRYLSPVSGTICDPFMGMGTTGLAALKQGRSFVGIEKKSSYFDVASRRLGEALDAMATPLFST